VRVEMAIVAITIGQITFGGETRRACAEVAEAEGHNPQTRAGLKCGVAICANRVSRYVANHPVSQRYRWMHSSRIGAEPLQESLCRLLELHAECLGFDCPTLKLVRLL
jgi:hypothetical protein